MLTKVDFKHDLAEGLQTEMGGDYNLFVQKVLVGGLSVKERRPFLEESQVKQALSSDRSYDYIVLSLADNDVIKYRKDDHQNYANLDLAVEGIRKDLC